MNLDELRFGHITAALEAGEANGIILLKKVMLPEADVLCLLYKEKRVNLKSDLDYGVFLEAVDAMSQDEMDEVLDSLFHLNAH
jgi:hypothetical protein